MTIDKLAEQYLNEANAIKGRLRELTSGRDNLDRETERRVKLLRTMLYENLSTYRHLLSYTESVRRG